MRIDNIDPLSKNAITPPRKTQAAPSLTPQQVQRLSEIKTRAGWVPPDQQLLLARSGATDDAVDAVANLNAKQIVEAQVEEEKGSWLRRNVYDPLKAATRWGTAGLNFVPEFVQGGIAQIFDEGTNVDGFFISTELGSMIENPELQGEGFFAGAELKAKQGERARRYRGTVNGSAWTVGRGAANLVFKENTKPYTVMSGILDALVMVKADPTKAITGAIKAGTKGGLIFRGIDEATGEVRMFSRAKNVTEGATLIKPSVVPLVSDLASSSIREALENEAGVVRGLADISLDGTKFDTFTRTNGRMVNLINRLVNEKDALKIAEDIFDHKLPNELVVALAEANDPDVVRKLLAAGWTVGKGALPEDIRNIHKGFLFFRKSGGFGNFIVEKVPLIDGIRKSRFFTRMEPGAVNMLGDQRSNTQAVKSIVSYLRTAGVDQETVSEIGNMALKSFTPGASDVARRKTLDTFTSTLRSVMKTDGIPQESIDELFARGGNTLTKIRTYLIDRTGTAADNGYSSFLLNKNRDYLPSEEIETLLKDLGAREGDKLTIVSPTELVEMLDRTVVLPDLREVRRFTRNPIFRDLIGDKFGKLPITTKRQLRTVEVITDQKEYDRLGEEIRALVVKADKTSADFDKLDDLYKQRNDLKVLEPRKVITPEQRMSVALIDLMQNELWKPLNLATGGYIVRNSLDAQFRMAMSDLPSLFSHPFEYINLVLGSSKKMTLRLEDIANVRRPLKEGQVAGKGVITVDDLVDDVREAMTFGLRQQGLGPIDIERHMAQTGVFPIVDRATNGLAMHTDAIIQQGRRSTNDVLRKVANQTFVEYGGISTPARDAAVERIVNVIMSNKGIRKQIDDMHEYGFQIVNDATGKTTRMPAIKIRDLPEDEIKATYRQYAYRIVVDNQQYMTGGIPEMNFMYAFGYTPITEKGRMVGAFDALAEDVVSLEPDDAIKVGAVVRLGDDQIGVITKLRDAATDEMVIDPFDGSVVPIEGRTATIQPVHPNRSFESLKGSYEARRLIDRMPVTDAPGVPGLPAKTKLELMETIGYRNDKFGNFKKTLDDGTDWFFGRLYGTVTRRLERSPVFREYYYRTVLDYVDRLQPDDAQRFLDDVAEKAKEAGVSVQKYVGSKDLISALKKSAKTGGDITLEELDDYAKFSALNSTKELLYDASARTNIEDIARIIMPFAPAWKEILGTYIGFLKSNPVNTARSFQRIYTGMTGADPDNDGRGFFYNDPQTGQMMFTFPGSGTLAKALTGLDATLEAPTKRLSQGIQAFPALGPMAQVAASKILPHLPASDELTGIFLPYGPKEVGSAFNPLPSWLNKAQQVLTAPETNKETVYANTYIETFRALSATGDYDLDSKEDVAQLESDARFKARILTAFRALSQFFGPTAGATEFKVPTDQGDQFVGELIKAFYDYQADPSIGYDGAVPKFLETFGDEAALYVASKSKAIADGLEATQEYQDWADKNGSLIRDYENTARYLAPAGSDFNFSVWSLQLQAGERVQLSAKEILELAQRRVGSAKYREARLTVGPYPSEDARAALKAYRAYLHDKYPGFPANAEFEVGAYYNDVLELKQLVSDKRAVDNPTAQSIREYLVARDEAIARSGVSEQGFKTAKKALRFRMQLESFGVALAEQNPNFARIWDRLLASEVE